MIDVEVSRRMGLFVVGRLAARHGIRVRLRRIQPCGLSALVWLPETVAEPETVTAIVPAPTAARRTVASDWFIGEATAARLPRRTPNGNRLAEFQRGGGCPGHRRMPPVRPEQRLLAGRRMRPSRRGALRGTLTGSGSTFQLTFQEEATSGFKSVQPGIAVNYDGIGSGKGRARLAAGTVGFAGSDTPIPPAEAGRLRARRCSTSPS